jgi:hypothetical protein
MVLEPSTDYDVTVWRHPDSDTVFSQMKRGARRLGMDMFRLVIYNLPGKLIRRMRHGGLQAWTDPGGHFCK